MVKKANQDNFSIRVAAYIRVSTEEQKIHGLSVEAQTTALEDWAKKNDLKIVQFYNDAGFSARKPYHKRPAMVKLLEDVEANKIDLIIFTKLDRWFRSLPDYFKVQEILEKNNVNWRTIHEDYDTATASGRLKVNIMLSVAQDEADRTSERIKAVFEAKRQRREPLTGNTPTGYKLDGKKMVKDPGTERAVNAFFQKFLACGSISVAQQEALDNGKRLEYQLASKMLDSPVYYGYYYGVDGMAPPYITKEEFRRIQGMRHRVTRKSPKNRVYLFSGLVVCGDCGTRMGGRKQTHGKTPFYNCPGHYIKRTDCRNKTNISESIIEDYLMSWIEQKMEEYKIEVVRLEEEQEKKDYKSSIAALKARSKRLTDLYLNDLISIEDCKSGCAEIEGKIKALEEEAAQVYAPDLSVIEEVLKEGWKEDYYSLPREDKREFWMMLIDKILVFPDRHIECSIRRRFL